jgi:hypothetical protein
MNENEELLKMTPEVRRRFFERLGAPEWADLIEEAEENALPKDAQAALQHTKDEQEWQANQAALRQQMEAKVARTKGYYARGIVRDKYLKMGLGKPYEPQQQAKNPEQLMSDYRAEMSKVRPGSEGALLVRSRYRKMGLDV